MARCGKRLAFRGVVMHDAGHAADPLGTRTHMFWHKCRLHKTELKSGSAPILYGLLRLPGEYKRARRRHFPRAASWVPGGCVVDWRVSEGVRYCSGCREAEREWNAAHPEDSVGPVEIRALKIENPGSDPSRVVKLLRETFLVSAQLANSIANGCEEVFASAVDTESRSLRSLLEEAGATVCEVRVRVSNREHS